MSTASAAPAEAATEITTEIPAVPAETSPPSAAAGERVVVGAESAPISAADYTKGFVAKLRQLWIPPDLWSEGRPPLRAQWLWAVHGEHLPEHEYLRHTSRAVTAVLLPFRALFQFLDWIFERGSRVVAAALLVLAVVQAINPIF